MEAICCSDYGDYQVLNEPPNHNETKTLKNIQNTLETQSIRTVCVTPPSIIKMKRHRSLRRDFITRLCTLFDSVNPDPKKWMRLIVDNSIYLQITKFFSRSDMMSKGFSAVETLESYATIISSTTTNSKESSNTTSGLPTLYIIHPTERTLTLLPLIVSRIKAPYTYLCILSPLLPSATDKINRTFGVTLREVIDFRSDVKLVERNSFTLDIDTIPALYFKQHDREHSKHTESDLLSATCKVITDKLVSLVKILGVVPVVRTTTTTVAKTLGSMFDEVVRTMIKDSDLESDNNAITDTNTDIDTVGTTRMDIKLRPDPNTTIIFLDRSYDQFSPLSITSSLEALMDLCGVSTHLSKRDDESRNLTLSIDKKTHNLSTYLWEKVRCLDMPDAQKMMANLTQKFIAQQVGAEETLKTGMNTMRPEERAVNMLINMDRNKHINVHSSTIKAINDCHEISVKKRLYSVVEKEGINTNSDSATSCMSHMELENEIMTSTANSNFSMLVTEINTYLSNQDDVHLKMIIVLLLVKKLDSLKIKDRWSDNLIKQHKLNDLKISHSILTVKSVVDNETPTFKVDAVTKLVSKAKDSYSTICGPIIEAVSTESMNTFTPKIIDLIFMYNTGMIDDTIIPQVNGDVVKDDLGRSLRRINKTVKNYYSGHNHTHRLILFIAGGMTFSEMRMAELMSNKTKTNVIMGATSVLTPKSYIDQLSRLQ
ncbi:Sec1-like protein [Yasminevirus sp. GU-2018]|uniref:Sec1-like protein n=1 Tax=Yasminevirus sp. GU-2018 TaxID=2420051 RepID=A0A5K0U943_9VIRU|nr:Sec1-like protein [Yasminevirus sp. GU-2018]